MLTLKLYSGGLSGRAVIMEVAGVWIDECGYGVKSLTAFRKKVGVEDEDGCFGCYFGGERAEWNKMASHGSVGCDQGQQTTQMIVLDEHVGGNYFTWGVLENAQGKTTEMLR